MKGIVDSASELIGKTPMLYLHNYMKEAGVEDAAIIAKLEYFNPAGSVKDRVALALPADGTAVVTHKDDVVLQGREHLL